jgi:hypothetical protein
MQNYTLLSESTIRRTDDTTPIVQLYYQHMLVENEVSWIRHEAIERIKRLTDITQTPLTQMTYAVSKIDLLLTPAPFWGIENMALVALDSANVGGSPTFISFYSGHDTTGAIQ